MNKLSIYIITFIIIGLTLKKLYLIDREFSNPNVWKWAMLNSGPELNDWGKLFFIIVDVLIVFCIIKIITLIY